MLRRQRWRNHPAGKGEQQQTRMHGNPQCRGTHSEARGEAVQSNQSEHAVCPPVGYAMPRHAKRRKPRSAQRKRHARSLPLHRGKNGKPNNAVEGDIFVSRVWWGERQKKHERRSAAATQRLPRQTTVWEKCPEFATGRHTPRSASRSSREPTRRERRWCRQE
jgi:hypothetical protein